MVVVQSEKFLESLGKGRRLNEISLQEAKGILTGFAALMGIPANNLPAEEIMMATIQGLVRNFGSMYEGEVRTAFEMAITGKVEVEGHYQSLSLKYICNVLNAYRVKVNSAMRYYDRHRIEPPHEDLKADWSETLDDLAKDPNMIIPVAIYDWMIEKGIINPSKEEKVQGMKDAERKIREDLQALVTMGKASSDEVRDLEKIRGGYVKGDRIHHRVANEAKKILVKSYLLKKR
jgi:hypothetical protein